MSTFSISATYTELVELLGFVLRNKLGYKMICFPHWDFKLIKATFGDEPETYLGKGRFMANLKDEERRTRLGTYDDDDVEVRTKCELIGGCDGQEWTINIWLKFPNGTIRGYGFEKSSSEETPQESSRAVPALPPSEISFK